MSGYIQKLQERGQIINLKGKPFVLLPGLLELAFENGLEGWDSTCIAHSDKDRSAVFKTIIKGERGTYTGHGDASPANVSKNILPSYLRMAETRSLCRALRFYLGIGMCARDELPGAMGEEQPPKKPSQSNEGLTIDQAHERINAFGSVDLVDWYRKGTNQVPLVSLNGEQRQMLVGWLEKEGGLERKIIDLLYQKAIQPEQVLDGVRKRLMDARSSNTKVPKAAQGLCRLVGDPMASTNISLMCAAYDELTAA